MKLFVLLLMMHALTDFALQPRQMALGKSKKTNELEQWVPWYYWLTSHALIQGFGIYLITCSMTLGITEVILHWCIDHLKCIGMTNIHEDQLIHILCLIIYTLIYHIWAGALF